MLSHLLNRLSVLRRQIVVCTLLPMPAALLPTLDNSTAALLVISALVALSHALLLPRSSSEAVILALTLSLLAPAAPLVPDLLEGIAQRMSARGESGFDVALHVTGVSALIGCGTLMVLCAVAGTWHLISPRVIFRHRLIRVRTQVDVGPDVARAALFADAGAVGADGLVRQIRAVRSVDPVTWRETTIEMTMLKRIEEDAPLLQRAVIVGRLAGAGMDEVEPFTAAGETRLTPNAGGTLVEEETIMDVSLDLAIALALTDGISDYTRWTIDRHLGRSSNAIADTGPHTMMTLLARVFGRFGQDPLHPPLD